MTDTTTICIVVGDVPGFEELCSQTSTVTDGNSTSTSTSTSYVSTPPPSPVPLPAAGPLLGTALVALAAFAAVRRRRAGDA